MRRVLSGLFGLLLVVLAVGAGYLALNGGRLPARLASLPSVLRSPALTSPDPTGGPSAARDPDPADGDLAPTPSVLRTDADGGSPTPGHEEQHTPIGRPTPPARPSDSYAFLRTQQDGTPVAYDPCRPIHYVIRADQAPPGGVDMVQQAIARVAEATGLRFVDDGGSTELPSPERAAFQPSRYGDRWAPLLIAWRTEKQYRSLAGDTVGEGGSTAVGVDGRPTVFVSGQVVLDAPDLRRMMRTSGGKAEARGVLMHELGHVVGLDHVKDRTQLMYRRTVDGVTDYGTGDLTGLAALGRGACAPWL